MDPNDKKQNHRVVEIASSAAGAYAGRVLAEAGLAVLRIEVEETPALCSLPPFTDDGSSIPYLSLNGRKEIIRVDVRDPRGRALARRLISAASVFLTDDPAYFPLRCRGVTCHVHPGEIGIAGNVPSMDYIIQAMSGALSMTGPLKGPPSPIGIPVGDIAPGLFATIGILNGLLSDEPQAIEVRALDATLALMSYLGCSYLVGGAEMGFVGTGHPYVTPYGAYRAKDGHIIVAPGFTQIFWQNLCHMLGRADMIDDPKFATLTSRKKHRDELQAILDAAFMQDTVENWERRLNEADVPNGKVQPVRAALEHPVMQHRGMITEIGGRRFINSPVIQNTPGAEADGRVSAGNPGWHTLVHELTEGRGELEALLAGGQVAALHTPWSATKGRA